MIAAARPPGDASRRVETGSDGLAVYEVARPLIVRAVAEMSRVKLYRLKQAARLLGGSPSARTLREWAQAGKIEVSRSRGGSVYFLTESQLAKLLERLERRPS